MIVGARNRTAAGLRTDYFLRGGFGVGFASSGNRILIASRKRIRAICEAVLSSFPAISSRSMRSSGSRRSERYPSYRFFGPGMTTIYHIGDNP